MLLPVATLVACQPLLIPSGPPVGDLETLDPCQDPTTWFEDVDGDGYGVEDSTFETCGVPEAGWSLRIGDCDDADDGIYPGAIETCDGVDRDCSGRAGDHAIDRVERGIDADGDGHRDADLEPVLVCADTPGTVAPDAGLDCDDGDPTIHEGADDPLCDGIDQSCSGVVSEVARSGDVKFADLELALREADSSLVVCPGTYAMSGQAHMRGSLSIRGRGPGADAVVLVGDGGRVLDLEIDGELRLERLTLRGGRADGDGGGLRASAERVVMERVTFEDHVAGGNGGAASLRVASGDGRLSHVEVRDSHAGRDGGGLHIAAREPGGTVAISIEEARISGTTARRHGGAVAGSESLRFANSTVENSQAGGDGGALHVTRSLNMTESTLRDGTAARGGLVAAVAPTGGEARVLLYSSDLQSGEAGAGGLAFASGSDAGASIIRSTLAEGTAVEGGLVAIHATSLPWLNTWQATLQRGEADRGAGILVTGMADSATDFTLRTTELSDCTGDVALRLAAERSDHDERILLHLPQYSGAPTSIVRNASGGVSMLASYEAVMDSADLGSGPDDNGAFDLQIGERTFSWEDPITAECTVDGCVEE